MTFPDHRRREFTEVWVAGNARAAVLSTLTARYTRTGSGYMGQVVEWPEVVTEGKDLEECRALLQDALKEVIAAYHQLGREIPQGGALLEQIPVELADVRQAG